MDNDNYTLRITYTDDGVHIESREKMSGFELHMAMIKINNTMCGLITETVNKYGGSKQFEKWMASRALTSGIVGASYETEKPERGTDLHTEYIVENSVALVALKSLEDMSEMVVRMNGLSDKDREAAAILIMGAMYGLQSMTDEGLLMMMHEFRNHAISAMNDPSEAIMHEKEGADE